MPRVDPLPPRAVGVTMSVFHFNRDYEPETRIQAIAHVRMEAPPGIEADLIRFYQEVCRLEPAPPERGMLAFRAERLQLHIRITPDAQPSRMRRKLILDVPSLQKLSEQLSELDIRYEWYRGMRFTDQRIFAYDPADNLIEFKQTWRF